MLVFCGGLNGIINTILDLTDIEAGQFDLVEEPFLSVELLQDVIAATQAQASSRNLALITDAAEMPPCLLGDKTQLTKAIVNYVSNAIRFTDAGTITLRLRPVADIGEYVLIRCEVEDTGAGIAPEDVPRLFSVFEQVDNSTTRSHGGLGLGLAMTRKIAEIMGGDAGCTSALRKGSTFWFTARLKIVQTADSATHPAG